MILEEGEILQISIQQHILGQELLMFQEQTPSVVFRNLVSTTVNVKLLALPISA